MTVKLKRLKENDSDMISLFPSETFPRHFVIMQVEKKSCEKFVSNNVDSKEVVLPPLLQACIDNVIKKEGYLVYNVEKKVNTPDGGNYLAVLYEIDIKGKTDKGDKETNIFVKNIIPSDGSNGFVNISEAYLREVFVYKDLLPIFTFLQDKANVPSEDRFKGVKCYDETNSENIIMENMTKKGYRTPNRMNVVSLKFAELSVKQIATLHGLSFAIRNKMPEYYDKTIKNMKKCYECNDEWKAAAANLAKIIVKNLEPDLKKKAMDYVPIFLEKYPEYIEDSTKEIGCICHGDFRPNNIIMKETEGEATDVILIDYQVLHYGCPVNDMLYFIAAGTDREFRDKHMEDLKNLYYDTFEKFLRYFDIVANDVYPRQEFESTFKKRQDQILMIAMFFYPFFFAPDSDIPDLGNKDMKEFDYELTPDINNRIKEIMVESIELGFL